MQRAALADLSTHWWITDAFVTAQSGTAATMRRKWLWQQVNRFRNIAGIPPIPRYAPRTLLQRQLVQHSDSVMDDLAGPTEGWLGFASTSTSLTYKTGDEFTVSRAALLIQHITGFRCQPHFAAGRGDGLFSNRIYVDGADRVTMLSSLRAQPGVTVFENRNKYRTVADRVAAFNASAPGP